VCILFLKKFKAAKVNLPLKYKPCVRGKAKILHTQWHHGAALSIELWNVHLSHAQRVVAQRALRNAFQIRTRRFDGNVSYEDSDWGRGRSPLLTSIHRGARIFIQLTLSAMYWAITLLSLSIQANTTHVVFRNRVFHLTLSYIMWIWTE
jgi:hypothetical protein